MKKITVIFLVFVLLVSSVFQVSAAGLEEVADFPLNYTQNTSFTVKLENADEILAFIEKYNTDTYLYTGFLDIRTFIRSCVDMDGSIEVKCDISSDFKNIKMMMSSETTHIMDFNQNLNVLVKPKYMAWVNIDLSDSENPCFVISLLTPSGSKYYVADLFGNMIPEEYKESAFDVISGFCDSGFDKNMKSSVMNLIQKYAEIKFSSDDFTIKFDNESFINFSHESIKVFSEMISDKLPDFFKKYFAYKTENELEKVLGENGIVIDCKVHNKKLVSCDMKSDIELSVSEITEKLIGETWEFDEELNIRMSLNYESDISDIDSSTVEFPEIDNDNSENIYPEDFYYMFGYYDYDYDMYPVSWVRLETDMIYVLDSVVYLPFEDIISYVYGDKATISKDNDTINVNVSEDDFEKIVLKIWDKTVYVDGTAHEIGSTRILDDKICVDMDLFNKILGWDLSVNYKVIDGVYTISGSTYTYVEEEVPYNIYPRITTGYIPFIEGQSYMPLEEILRAAFNENVTFDYSDGKVKAEILKYPKFSTLELKPGDSVVYADDKEYSIKKVFEENGVIYVHPELFTEVFGWELEEMTKSIPDNVYTIRYYTNHYREIY